MSFEPRIFEALCSCQLTIRDEILNPICQVCGGSGTYIDWNFDEDGNLNVIKGLPKLQQMILKIMLSYVGSNDLYPLYGSNVEKMIGTKSLGTHTELRIQQDIYDALSYLKQRQQDQRRRFNNLDPAEALSTIESITVEQVIPTAYIVFVSFTTELSESASVTSTIGGYVDPITQTQFINRLLGGNKTLQG